MAGSTDVLFAALKVAVAIEALKNIDVGETVDLPEIKVKVRGKRLRLKIQAECEP